MVFSPIDRAAALRLVVVGNLLVIVMACSAGLTHARDLDFNIFWEAGHLANQGNALSAWTVRIFPYPPPFMLFVQPFALVAPGVAVIGWVTASLGLLMLVARRLAYLSPKIIVAFPPVVVNGIIGQTGLITAALFVAAARLLARRPFWAGVCFGALIIKPQMGVLIPVALLAGREGRAFAGAAVSVTVLTALALIAYGPAAFIAWAHVLYSPVSILLHGGAGWEKMASLFATLRQVGVSAPLAWTCHIAAALVALAAVIRTWQYNTDADARCAVLACATALTSPYWGVYDLPLLILPLAWYAHRRRSIAWPVIIGASYGAAVLLNWAPHAFPNPSPFATLVLLYLVWRSSERAIGEALPGALRDALPRNDTHRLVAA